MHTYYDDLHVSEDAGLEVIKAAYKALANKYHPDKNPDQPERAAEHFRVIVRAFEVLSNSRSRADYDDWLKKQRTSHEEWELEPAPATQRAKSQPRETTRAGPLAISRGLLQREAPPALVWLTAVVGGLLLAAQLNDDVKTFFRTAWSTSASLLPSAPTLIEPAFSGAAPPPATRSGAGQEKRKRTNHVRRADTVIIGRPFPATGKKEKTIRASCQLKPVMTNRDYQACGMPVPQRR